MARVGADVEAMLEHLAQQGAGGLNPGVDQLSELMAEAPTGPLHFVNLLAFHEVARYPAGHELADRGLSGAQAYGRYGAAALEHVQRRGGRLVLYNGVDQTLIGPPARFEQVAIMEYPDAGAFLDMIGDAEYQAALVHRDAGLAETVVLVTRPLLSA